VWITYRFASELHGKRLAGLAACAMYALCPTICAQASLVGTDAGSAVAMLASTWLWWRFCRQPTAARAALAGLAFAAAHLCKFYAVLLWPMAVLISAWYVAMTEAQRRRLFLRHALGGLALSAAITLFLINAAYGFSGTFRRLRSYDVHGSTLRAIAHVLPGGLPIPLPANYIIGYDAA
jgi:4-amino-4-deoxy-L-arabinose transferase-like glycosyltransferase